MATTDLSQVHTIERVLDYQLARHNVLVSNLANADTPGFRARELVFQEELEGILEMQGDAPGHVRGEASTATVVEVEGESARADGNGVRIEATMTQIAANRIRYEAAIEIVRRQLGMVRYASTNGETP